jgi:EAL domain-containing protein (putative c-di-GMP-specific phosphodiesterase class I)
MSFSKTCGVLPEPFPRTGWLYIAIPSKVGQHAVRAWASSDGAECCSAEAEVLWFEIQNDRLDRFCAVLPKLVPTDEIEDVRMLVTTNRADSLTPSDILRMGPAAKVMARVETEWFVDMLREQRFTTAFQPIVNLQNGAEIFGYECLIRGQMLDGQVVFPDRILDSARKMNLMFQLDRMARITAIENAARHGVSQTIFINFNPTTIYSPEACLRTTIEAAERSGIDPGRIVFEVTESEEVKDRDHLLRIVEYYRKTGFRVALDDLGSGYSSLNMLADLRPDFVKLDMRLIQGVDRDPFKQHVARHLLELAKALGIQTVVEGVETAAEWEWVKSHGASLAQGYFYARPALEPPRQPDTSFLPIDRAA